MFKHIKFAALALLISAGFVACSDDDNDAPAPVQPRGEAGMYIINQGNQAEKLNSTIDFVSFATNGTNVSGLFQSVNNQALGSSAQKPIIYGSKMYIPMYDNNLVWVADANTMKIVAKIETNEPEAVCGSEGYVFINNNDGYVTRVDTTNFASSKIEVGPNPAPLGITAYDGRVYVSISDGYNYANGYVNGKKVVIINAKTFTKEKEIAVGLNPGQITTDANGNVFVVCQGNYASIQPEVWRITPNDVATEFCKGSFIATASSQERGSRAQAKADALYVIYIENDWVNYTSTFSSAVYNTQTGEAVIESFLPTDKQPEATSAMDINPKTGDVYVCSDAGQYDYSTPGHVYVYSANGTFLKQYFAGVHPYGVVFK